MKWVVKTRSFNVNIPHVKLCKIAFFKINTGSRLLRSNRAKMCTCILTLNQILIIAYNNEMS